MGTTEYLESLAHCQLEFAKKEVERLLADIEEQTKTTLWIVNDGGVNTACYLEADWELAKAKLSELILLEKVKPKDLNHFFPHIYKKTAPESELEDWMSLNKTNKRP